MKSYEELTIQDDFLFSKVMSRPDLCKKMIEVCLDIKVDKINIIEREYNLAPLADKHSIRLDVFVKDTNKIYDIEMQTTNEHNLEKRARYYQSVIDIEELDKSTNYKELKETYIIFICTFDPFKLGKLKYDVKTVFLDEINNDTEKSNTNYRKSRIKNIQDVAKNFSIYNDNTHKIFYNLTSSELDKADSELAEFLNYLAHNKVEGKFSTEIDNAVNEAKYFKPWRKQYMTLQAKLCDTFDNGFNKGKLAGITIGKKRGKTEGIAIGEKRGEARGKSEGEKFGKTQVAKSMLSNGISLDMIEKCTGLSPKEISELK